MTNVVEQTTTKRTTLSHHDGVYSASASTLVTAALAINPTKDLLTFHSPHELKAHWHASESRLFSWQKRYGQSEHNTWYCASSEAPSPLHCLQ